MKEFTNKSYKKWVNHFELKEKGLIIGYKTNKNHYNNIKASPSMNDLRKISRYMKGGEY